MTEFVMFRYKYGQVDACVDSFTGNVDNMNNHDYHDIYCTMII